MMGWHDSKIYAVAFVPQFELAFDIDYIFQWLRPEGEECFRFWVSAATLIFENVYDFKAQIGLYTPELEIDAIRRTIPRRPRNADFIQKETEWKWVIDCHQGEFNFQSSGYKMFVRSEPCLIASQTLD